MGGTTDIVVYYEGIVWHTAVIPFGGNVITKDIKEGCAILPRQAENLKITCGTCLPEAADEDTVIAIEGSNGRDVKEISYKSLACIINARMEEIIDAVTFEIENSGVMEKLSAGIVVTGGGALLRDLPQLIKFKTGMDVRIGYPCEQLAANTNETINHPMYSTAIGLILRGYEYLAESGENNNENGDLDSDKNNSLLKDEPMEQPIDNDKSEDKAKHRFSIFDNLKKIQDRMMDMFEENDAKME